METWKEVDDMFVIFEQLHPHYTYGVSVAAVTVAAGPLSNATTFTMPQDGTLYFSLAFHYTIKHLCI